MTEPLEQPQTNDANEQTGVSIEETLEQRGTRYGSFEDHAAISRALQSIIFSALARRGKEIPPYIAEATSMICHKLGRIANGDPFYDDSWRDIAGYSQLVVDILNKKDA